jgi:DNA-nicking Smr family endonuclease
LKKKPRSTGGSAGSARAKGSARSPSAEGLGPFAGLKNLKIAPRDEPKSKISTPKGPPATPALPEDDHLNLHRMLSGVTPLDSKAKRIPRSQSAVPSSNIGERHASAKREEEDAAAHAQLRALVEGGRFEVDDDGRRVEGRRTGVPHEVLRKLRHGMFPIDARLDLHGLRAEEARDALERFLGAKRSKGERCVLVVHGKGEHSPGRQGILRGEMAAWLSQAHASIHVAAFATAGEEDGGEGAMYVLLVR